jgi:hypothetical protein
MRGPWFAAWFAPRSPGRFARLLPLTSSPGHFARSLHPASRDLPTGRGCGSIHPRGAGG